MQAALGRLGHLRSLDIGILYRGTCSQRLLLADIAACVPTLAQRCSDAWPTITT